MPLTASALLRSVMKLLVAVDGSEHALEAAWHGLRQCASDLRVEFALGKAQEPTFLFKLVLPSTSDMLERVGHPVGHRALEGAEAPLSAAGVPCECQIGSGEVAPTLLSIARAGRLRPGRAGRTGTWSLPCCVAGRCVSGSSAVRCRAKRPVLRRSALARQARSR